MGIERYSPIRNFQEQFKSPECLRGTLGFDFIFPADSDDLRKIICIEINGSNSGINGIKKIPKETIGSSHKSLSKIRMRINPEKIDAINYLSFLNEKKGLDSIKDETHKKAISIPLFIYAFKNPKVIENLTLDKNIQYNYIPDSYKAELYDPSKNNCPPSGIWVLKPHDGMRGKNVIFVRDEEVEDVHKDFKNYFVFQEFVYPAGADLAPANLKDHPFLTDFRAFDDGSMQTVFESAYMRVSPLKTDLDPDSSEFQDTFVVNLCRKARAVPASPRELELARQASSAIIKILNSLYFRPLASTTNSNIRQSA